MSGEETTVAPRKIWRYASQAWTQVDDPLINTHGPSLDGALSEIGYTKADSWSGEAVEIYVRGEEGRWIVCCCFDADKSYLVEVPSLPDLIGLLAQLAPIATASLLSTTDHFLKPLIYNVSEDAAKERTRRRSGRGAVSAFRGGRDEDLPERAVHRAVSAVRRSRLSASHRAQHPVREQRGAVPLPVWTVPVPVDDELEHVRRGREVPDHLWTAMRSGLVGGAGLPCDASLLALVGGDGRGHVSAQIVRAGRAQRLDRFPVGLPQVVGHAERAVRHLRVAIARVLRHGHSVCTAHTAGPVLDLHQSCHPVLRDIVMYIHCRY